MAGETVLNHFKQTPGPQGAMDNVLQLGGTVFQGDGTQAAAIADVPTAPADVDSNAAAINAILAVLRNTGLIAT